MLIAELIPQIDAYQRVSRRSDADISKEVGKSPDLIRSWRRRLEAGDSKAETKESTAHRVLNIVSKDFETNSKEIAGYGLSEPAVAPWVPRSSDSAEFLMKHLAPTAKNPSPFLLREAMPQLSYPANTILVVDLNSRPETGDIVIANKIDENLGTGETVIGHFYPPFIATHKSEDPHIRVNHTVRIYGPVVSFFKNPEN